MFYVLIGLISVIAIGFGLNRLFFFRPKQTKQFQTRFTWSIGLIALGVGCLFEPTKMLSASLALGYEVKLPAFTFGYALGNGIGLGIIGSLVGILLDLMYQKKKKSPKATTTMPVKDEIAEEYRENWDGEAELDDEKFYAKAAKELESGKQLKGAWAKAQVMTQGDDEKARLKYIELRVEALLANVRKKQVQFKEEQHD